MELKLKQKLGICYSDFFDFCKRIKNINTEISDEEFSQAIIQLRPNNFDKKALSTDELELILYKNILLDLISQGWSIKIEEAKIFLNYINRNNKTSEEEKSIIRKSHLVQRDHQLKESSVIDFLTKMERKRLTKNGWHSIYSLMRDGKDLATSLKQINLIKERDLQLETLSNNVKPYIQFADKDTKCEFTDLPLLDIWRYFRHTWVTPYKVLPGRSISILIRDAAAPNHPIIGIGALGSSVAQHTVRDNWIGWNSQKFISNISRNPTAKIAKHLLNSLSSLLNNIYLKDLIDEEIISQNLIKFPNREIINSLKEKGEEYIKLHRKFPNPKLFSKLKNNKLDSNTEWKDFAESYLYKSKRCKTLSTLLKIRYIFQKNNFTKGTKKELTECLKDKSFEKAISLLIRKIKAERVGNNMMDIIVCGAIEPYNAILGGKLVCHLLTSPEVTNYYKSKYKKSVSIIASSMKGAKVTKNQDLVFLGTTSLYDVGASQYNRIKIPAEKIGGEKGEKIKYINLGLSEGFGSFHFSKNTIALMDYYAARKDSGKIVNSIFGEGANPLLRKIRGVLEDLQLPSENILKHGYKRLVFGVPLASNFKEILIGLEKRPKFLIPQNKSGYRSKLLVKYWLERWLIKRIQNPDVLIKVEQHNLEYPITHGARVPRISEDNEKYSLFN